MPITRGKRKKIEAAVNEISNTKVENNKLKTGSVIKSNFENENNLESSMKTISYSTVNLDGGDSITNFKISKTVKLSQNGNSSSSTSSSDKPTKLKDLFDNNLVVLLHKNEITSHNKDICENNIASEELKNSHKEEKNSVNVENSSENQRISPKISCNLSFANDRPTVPKKNTMKFIKKNKGAFISNDIYNNLLMKQFLKKKKRNKSKSIIRVLKNSKNPPKPQKLNELYNEIQKTEEVVDKVKNIVIRMDILQKNNGCGVNKQIKEENLKWDTEKPACESGIISNSLDNCEKSENIQNIKVKNDTNANTIIKKNNTNMLANVAEILAPLNQDAFSEFDTGTSFSNKSSVSNCDISEDNHSKFKNLFSKNDTKCEQNPFSKYKLESFDFNIKITSKNFSEKTPKSLFSSDKKWNHAVPTSGNLRITSNDPIFKNAVIEENCEILEKENYSRTKLSDVEDKRNWLKRDVVSLLKDHDSQKSLLPPAKRPPTRRQPPEPSMQVQTKKVSTDSIQEDDVISLLASSDESSLEYDKTILDHNNIKKDQDFSEVSKFEDDVEEEEINENIPSTSLIEKNLPEKNKNVKDLHKNDYISIENNQIPFVQSFIIQNNDNKKESKTFSSSTLLKNRETNNVREYIPKVFRGLCLQYFTNNTCNYKMCYLQHKLFPDMDLKIFRLSYQKLVEAYNFTKNKNIFKELFSTFVSAFVKLKNISLLVNMVRDVVEQDQFERSPFIEKVVKGIERIGSKFSEAINHIIHGFGDSNLGNANICLSDILLNIIVRSNENLESNWFLVKKLIKNRTEKLDHGVVEDILRRCVNFHKKLSECVFYDIFDKDLVCLLSVNDQLMKSFIFTLKNLHFTKESFKLMELTGLVVTDVISDENSENELGLNSLYFNETNELNCSFSQPKNQNITKMANYSDLRSNTSASDMSSSKYTVPPNLLTSLSNIIRKKDVSRFLGLIERIKDEEYALYFVKRVLVLLHKEDIRDVYKLVMKMFNTIHYENNRDRFWFDQSARFFIETLSFNILAIFHEKASWKQAAHIIRKFSNDYPNFVKAIVIQGSKQQDSKFHKYKYSQLGKYLYFCKIFSRAGYFQEAYDLLMNPGLNLLGEHSFWTIDNNCMFDISLRNDVVEVFIKCAMESSNLILLKKLLLFLINKENCYISIDVWKYYNDFLAKLIDGEEHEEIVQMFDDILNGWHLKLRKEVFRGLLVVLSHVFDLNDLNLLKLFSRACNRGFYKVYEESGKEIFLKTDMLQEEIYLILHLFFYRVFQDEPLVLQDLKLELQLPSEKVDDKPSMFINSNVSLKNFQVKIYQVLAVSFHHPICVQASNDTPTIVIDKKQLENLLPFYKTEFLL